MKYLLMIPKTIILNYFVFVNEIKLTKLLENIAVFIHKCRLLYSLLITMMLPLKINLFRNTL